MQPQNNFDSLQDSFKNTNRCKYYIFAYVLLHRVENAKKTKALNLSNR